VSKTNAAYSIVLGSLALLLAFPLALPTSFKMDETQDPLFQKIPMNIGAWKGSDTELDERTYEILETRNVLSRLYETAEGGKVHLLLVGSHRDRRVAHPPEVCYVSSHFSIVDGGERDVNLETSRSRGVSPRIGFAGQDAPPTRVGRLMVKEFIAKDQRRKGASEHVLYVYKVGDRFTTNYYAQQLFFAWDRLTQKKSQVLLIRLAGPDQSVFDGFLNQILPLLE